MTKIAKSKEDKLHIKQNHIVLPPPPRIHLVLLQGTCTGTHFIRRETKFKVLEARLTAELKMDEAHHTADAQVKKACIIAML